jgi:hypothetical protein
VNENEGSTTIPTVHVTLIKNPMVGHSTIIAGPTMYQLLVGDENFSTLDWPVYVTSAIHVVK